MGNKRGAAVAKGRGKAQPEKRSGGRLAGLREFVRGVRSELKKVSWPNRDQLQQSTAVVLIIVLVLAAFVAFWDYVFYYLARLVFA
jgi:preprotein translocase subunit SecE